MKNIIKLILCFSLLLGSTSCSKISPSGEIEVKDQSVENFTKLVLKGNFKVFFAKGEQNLISVETYPNIYKNLDIEVENGTLSIKESRTAENVDFYSITIFGKNELSEISMKDHVEMNVSGKINSPRFSLNLNDNSKFMGAISTQNASMEMSKKANANILGEAKQLTLKQSDSASLVAPYLFVENLEINAKNDAFAGINADNELKGTLENTSKLVYYGEPINKLIKKDKAIVENKKLK